MKKFLFLLLFLLVGKSYSQSIVWEKKFDGGHEHEIINKTADSAFIVSGHIKVQLNYPSHVVKYDWSGNIIWQKAGPVLVTGEQDIKQTADGGYVFTGAKRNNFSSQNEWDIVLQKFTATGDTVWKKIYITPLGPDYSNKLALATNGDIFNLGTAIEGSDIYYSLRRTDSLGNSLWYKKYARAINCYAADMIFNRKGNLILSGSSSISSNPVPYYHPYIIEVNQNGDSIRANQIIIKDTTYNEFIHRFVNNTLQTTDGGYVSSGNIDSSNYRIGFIVKLDSALQKQWVYIHQPEFPDNQDISRVAQLQDSSFLMLSNLEDNVSNKIILTKISPNGQLINKTILHTSWCSKVQFTDWEFLPDSSVVIVGNCLDTPLKAYMVKVGGVGLPAVVPPLPIDTTDTTTAALPPLPQQQASLGQSTPNPASTVAVVPYSLPAGVTFASIQVHNMVTGAKLQEVKIRAQEGNGSATLNLQQLSSGVYLYTLIVDGKPVSTKKMVVIK